MTDELKPIEMSEIIDTLCEADSYLSLIAYRAEVRNYGLLGMCSRDDLIRTYGKVRNLYNRLRRAVATDDQEDK